MDIINTKVILSRLYHETTEPFWMFGTQIDSLRKDIGHFLMQTKSSKGLKRRMKGCINAIQNLRGQIRRYS